MPATLRIGPYHFFFYSDEGNEPPHIHVRRDNKIAKFWLTPVRLQHSGGFNRQEIRRIQGLVEKNREQLLGEWNEHFGE
ncbi:MAG: DUF4160 domain-containing protein [Anaerolineae bacterium]